MRERDSVTVELQPPLKAAVALGAQQNFTSISDYVRRALVMQLRADGIDPRAAGAPAGVERRGEARP